MSPIPYFVSPISCISYLVIRSSSLLSRISCLFPRISYFAFASPILSRISNACLKHSPSYPILLVIYLRCYSFLSHVWCPVAWPVSQIPRPASCVLRPLSHVLASRIPCVVSRVSRRVYLVSCVSRLLSRVSCLPSHGVSCLVSRISWGPGAPENASRHQILLRIPPISSYPVMSYKLSSCFVSCVPCLVSRISRVLCLRLVSRVSCGVCRVSCLMSPVSCLASRVLCPVSRVCLAARASCLLSRIVSRALYLVPCVSCLMSPVPCLLPNVSYLVSRVSCLVGRVSCLVSGVSCLLSRVWCLLSPV